MLTMHPIVRRAAMIAMCAVRSGSSFRIAPVQMTAVEPIFLVRADIVGLRR